jgi:TetR/AcrR family transcriptional regulator, transcriptional repressor for nem operon
MGSDEPTDVPRKLTARGAETRTRILKATTALLRERGPARTTMDDICLASGTSKSQLYHHFGDKDAIVVAAVRAEAEGLIASEERILATVTTIEHLQGWRDGIVADNAAAGGRFGCTLGSLTTQLSDQSPAARAVLDESFATWRGLLASGLLRIRDEGGLAPEADVDALAIGVVAALQGGHILSQAARDSAPLAIALDMALDRVRSLAVE